MLALVGALAAVMKPIVSRQTYAINAGTFSAFRATPPAKFRRTWPGALSVRARSKIRADRARKAEAKKIDKYLGAML